MNFVPKKWGYERHIVNNEKYCGKEMFVAKDHFVSAHSHHDKLETFYIKTGQLLLLRSTNPDCFKKVDYNSFWSISNRRLVTHNSFSPDVILHNVDLAHKMEIYDWVMYPGDTQTIEQNEIHLFYALEDTLFYEFSTHDSPEDSYRLTESW